MVASQEREKRKIKTPVPRGLTILFIKIGDFVCFLKSLEREMKIRDLLENEIEIRLSEARKNPHFNPKVGGLESFSMHRRNKRMFVSYTDLPKLGVNPRSSYDTPIGIYSYPLTYVLDRAYRLGSLFNAALFASGSKYVQLFEQTSNKVLDLATYTKQDYEKDKESLIRFLRTGTVTLQDILVRIEDYEEDYTRNRYSYGKMIWYLVYSLEDDLMTGRTNLNTYKIFHKVFGYDAIVDSKGEGIIHPNEPTQAVHFNFRTIRHVEMVENTKPSQTFIDASAEWMERKAPEVVKELNPSLSALDTIDRVIGEIKSEVSVNVGVNRTIAIYEKHERMFKALITNIKNITKILKEHEDVLATQGDKQPLKRAIWRIVMTFSEVGLYLENYVPMLERDYIRHFTNTPLGQTWHTKTPAAFFKSVEKITDEGSVIKAIRWFDPPRNY